MTDKGDDKNSTDSQVSGAIKKVIYVDYSPSSG